MSEHHVEIQVLPSLVVEKMLFIDAARARDDAVNVQVALPIDGRSPSLARRKQVSSCGDGSFAN